MGEGERTPSLNGHLEEEFPGLKEEGYRVTSPTSRAYNCIAWAARDTARWWWPRRGPFGYWPEGARREETIEAFVQAFATLGFEPCPDSDLEPGSEKVVLFADAAGRPKHAARQLPSGRWTSKLGRQEDVEHGLRGLEGETYGRVVGVLRRQIGPAP